MMTDAGRSQIVEIPWSRLKISKLPHDLMGQAHTLQTSPTGFQYPGI